MKPRRHARQIFTGRLELGAVVDLAQLKLRTGAHRKTVDSAGYHIATTYEPGARLWINPGDRAIVTPVDLEDDRVACVEVMKVDSDGNPTVRLVCGVMAPGPVHVMRVPRPKSAATTNAAHFPHSAGNLADRLRDLARRARLEAVGGGS